MDRRINGGGGGGGIAAVKAGELVHCKPKQDAAGASPGPDKEGVKELRCGLSQPRLHDTCTRGRLVRPAVSGTEKRRRDRSGLCPPPFRRMPPTKRDQDIVLPQADGDGG